MHNKSHFISKRTRKIRIRNLTAMKTNQYRDKVLHLEQGKTQFGQLCHFSLDSSYLERTKTCFLQLID